MVLAAVARSSLATWVSGRLSWFAMLSMPLHQVLCRSQRTGDTISMCHLHKTHHVYMDKGRSGMLRDSPKSCGQCFVTVSGAHSRMFLIRIMYACSLASMDSILATTLTKWSVT